jgi:mannosyltransferase OCH1-like enzyme
MTSVMPIPKKLHYFWDGPAEMPLLNRRCYESWQKHLSDYEFFHWHSNNLEIDSPYYHKALKHQVWAFVSDYARLHALYEHGGIYLDADLEVTQSFTPLLENEFFIGFETRDSIAVGAFGAMPRHPIIREIMEVLDRQYGQSEQLVPIPLPQIVTSILAQRFDSVLQHATTGFYDKNAGVSVYPVQYFYPYNPFDPERPLDRLIFSRIPMRSIIGPSRGKRIFHWLR